MANDNENTFLFTWKIENYSSCFQDQKKMLRSPVFTAENLNSSKWYLELYPRGVNTEEFIALFLNRSAHCEYNKIITIDFKIDILSPSGECLVSDKGVNDPFVVNDSWGWVNFMNIEALANKMKNWAVDTLTIRCQMSFSKINKQAIGCEARTKIGVDQHLFRWIVEFPDSKKWSISKEFPFRKTSQIEINLSAPEDAIDITFYIVENDSSNSRFVNCKISLLDRKGTETLSQCATHLFRPKTNSKPWVFPSFLLKSQLNEKEDVYLEDGRFTLKFEISTSNEIESEGIVSVQYDTPLVVSALPTVDTISVLQNDIHLMYVNKKHTDVKLRIGNQMFPAHKSLLAARSSVFSTMFDQEMLEAKTGIVDIVDMDGKILELFLKFLYSGTVENLDYESASKLLIASDKYQVLSLKEKCCSFFMSILSIDNVCEVFMHADMVRHQQLKECALKFIKTNATKILTSPEWSHWTEKNIKLASEVVVKLSIGLGFALDATSK